MRTAQNLLVAALLVLASLLVPTASAGHEGCETPGPDDSGGTPSGDEGRGQGQGQGNGQGNDQGHGNGNGQPCAGDPNAGNCGNGQGAGQGANHGQGGQCAGNGGEGTGDGDDDSGAGDGTGEDNGDDGTGTDGNGSTPIDDDPDQDGEPVGLGAPGAAQTCTNGVKVDSSSNPSRIVLHGCLLAPRDRDGDRLASLWTYEIRGELGTDGGKLRRGHADETDLGPDPDDQRPAHVIPRSL